MTAILAHEFAHVVLGAQNIRLEPLQRNEELTDTVAALAGFGRILMEVSERSTVQTGGGCVRTTTTRLGYLGRKNLGTLVTLLDRIATDQPKRRLATVSRIEVDRVACVGCGTTLALPDVDARVILLCPVCSLKEDIRLSRQPDAAIRHSLWAGLRQDVLEAWDRSNGFEVVAATGRTAATTAVRTASKEEGSPKPSAPVGPTISTQRKNDFSTYGDFLFPMVATSILVALIGGFSYFGGRAPQAAEGVASQTAGYIPQTSENPATRNSAIESRNLADQYAEGIGVTKDDRRAAHLYEDAADQGDAYAQRRIAFIYADGKGVPKDDIKAVDWCQKAATQGEVSAQCLLGLLYEEGRGILRDDAKAAGWYRKAAMQGFAAAQSNLGVLYVDGRGVTKDYNFAVEWFRRAATQGNAIAQRHMGMMCAEGRGVRVSKVSA